MERDTEEWLRPWRVSGDEPDAPAGPTTRIPGAPGAASAAGGAGAVGVAGPSARGATVRLTRPTSPTPASRPAAGGAAVPTPSAPAGSDTERLPLHPGVATGPRGSAGAPSPPDHRPPTDGGGPGPGRLRTGLVGLLAGLVGAAIGTGATLAAVDDGGEEPTEEVTTAAESPSPSPSEQDVAVADPVPSDEGSTVVSTVAEAVLPSVVRIDVFVSEDDPDLGVVDVPAGVGSGVVYSDDGYVLTNYHVVEDSDTVQVQLPDGSEHTAEVVGTDRYTDLAVLRLDTAGLTPVTLRVDDPLRVGETAVAIGSPFGLDASVTAGVVSAVNRDLEVPGDAENASFVIPATIQTDAAINPGNSGGALVDASGRLIGINTAILTSTGGSQGVGFAIPTASVVAAAEQLIERGFVSHPFLGIAGLDVTNQLAASYQDDYGIELDGGAVVDEVVEGSAAADAGLRAGDVIVAFGDDDIRSMTDVIAAILRYDAGETVDVQILRDGERRTIAVTLGERDPAGG